MTNVIEEMIENQNKARQAKEAEAARLLDLSIEAQIGQLKTALGDFWLIIEEAGIEPVAKISNGAAAYIELEIPALEKYELAPIEIRWGKRNGVGPFEVWGRSFFFTLSEALAQARAKYPEYIESVKEYAIKKRLDKLMELGEVSSEEEARKIFDELVELDPDRREDWEQKLQRYLDWRERRLEQIANRRIEEEARRLEGIRIQDIKAGYIADLANWLQKRNKIEAENNILADQLRAAGDRDEYFLYKVTYALLATDEEGYREIETRSFWSREELPSFGSWPLANGNPFKPLHPVSVERFSFRPSLGPETKDIERGGVEISFAPYVSDQEIEERIAGIQELPEKPADPEGLDYWALIDCLERARKIVAQAQGEQESGSDE